jgi:DNA repair protein RadC
VFTNAIKQRAASIIVAHNHPSGNLEPSKEDREITYRLKEAGMLLGIELLDHVVFSQKGYFSFLEEGEI